MWWRFLHEAPRVGQGDLPKEAQTRMHRPALSSHTRAEGAAAYAPDPEAAERAAYNEYLSELAVRGRRKQWR